MKKSLALLLCLMAFYGKETYGKETQGKGVREYCLSLGVDWRIVESIGELEGIKRKGKPYPYIIRVNSRGVRIRGLREIFPHVYDCLNERLCRIVAEKLIRAGVRNFDIGYFQVNYYHYKGNKRELLEKGFTYKGGYKIACRIVSKLLKRYGYTARAVARYHSSNPERNYRYALKFWRKYREKLRER